MAAAKLKLKAWIFNRLRKTLHVQALPDTSTTKASATVAAKIPIKFSTAVYPSAPTRRNFVIKAAGPQLRPSYPPPPLPSGSTLDQALGIEGGKWRQRRRSVCVCASVCEMCVRWEVGGGGLSLRVSESQSVSPTRDARQPGFTHPYFPASSPHTHVSLCFILSAWGGFMRGSRSRRDKSAARSHRRPQRGGFFLRLDGFPQKAARLNGRRQQAVVQTRLPVFVRTHLRWRTAGKSRSRPSPERRPARDAAF